MKWATVALIVFLVTASMMYLGVNFVYINLIAGASGLVVAFLTLVGK